MINELIQEEFEGTMAPPMVVTETAEAIVDIWPYVKAIWYKSKLNLLVRALPAARALRLYCTGISHKAGIRFNP